MLAFRLLLLLVFIIFFCFLLILFLHNEITVVLLLLLLLLLLLHVRNAQISCLTCENCRQRRHTPTVTRNIRPRWNECAWLQADHNHDNDDAHNNRAIGGEWARGRRRWWSDDVGELYWGSRLTAKDERWRTKLGFWMFFFRCYVETMMDGTWKCVFLTHPSFHGIRICSVYQLGG